MQVSLLLEVFGIQTGIPKGLNKKNGNWGAEEGLMILLEGRGG